VAQESNETLSGTPVFIKPRNASADLSIRQSSDVFIEFNDLDSFCAKRLDWHIINMLPKLLSGQRQHVAAGNSNS
jgi:hypothetical protein